MPAVNKKWISAMAAWLIMAALCGLIGFLIILHYASSERPSEQFAIVIDAGSTQTRSSLYRITIHVPELIDWQERVSEEFASYREEHHQLDQDLSDVKSQLEPFKQFKFPLSNLLQVRQVSSCTNGGPLASISGPKEARDLINACLMKFTQHIKLLDFVDATTLPIAPNNTQGSELSNAENLPEADEVSRQLALTDHRINSVTHLYLGATAGMRALEQLNSTRAREKLRWIDEAIKSSNELLLPRGSPFVNRGFVGIIEGSDEASFGWISVNFVCDTLYVHAPLPPLSNSIHLPDALQNQAHVSYQLNEDDNGQLMQQLISGTPKSIGTLELGGASAQMAFQVVDNQLGSGQIKRVNLDEQTLSLFNGHYRMATRSDLCLGMSQAVLRLNYVALHRMFANSTTTSRGQSPQLHATTNSIVLQNPCLQRGARLKVSGVELAKLWKGTCLMASASANNPAASLFDADFRNEMSKKQSIEWVGTGQVGQCNEMLDDLIQPIRCKRYFSLCPANTNLEPPPSDMPFVTISGFNHALNVLNLEQAPSSAGDAEWQALSDSIRDKLGGDSINYQQFIDRTQEFCSTSSGELLQKYPKVNEKFQQVICLQLIYIRKLLIEFYRFEPATSWSRIKFLIFAPNSVPSQFSALKKTSTPDVKQIKLDVRRDIGWTLGLLLNATSYQLGLDHSNQVYFHHGATVMYIIRATILLMLACFLIAISLLVVGIVGVRQAQDNAEAYISHSSSLSASSSSSSSYDVSHLAPTNHRTHSKATGLKYVLTS